ncbi:hypothetical protein BKA64DRAFT_634831 [Cadophora sp. MPI-SDFR-AT-0126]|nr:hypothetical protein BKA64DRAFT_634831 [Leotiomycetes sp. MPI-SDFR-AT-0126]
MQPQTMPAGGIPDSALFGSSRLTSTPPISSDELPISSSQIQRPRGKTHGEVKPPPGEPRPYPNPPRPPPSKPKAYTRQVGRKTHSGHTKHMDLDLGGVGMDHEALSNNGSVENLPRKECEFTL